MITLTVLAAYALGMIFAPASTRSVLKALGSVVGMLAVVLFVFWRIFPGSTGGTLRRY